ncbi:MAG: YebC/PmpR family DNA-binding transcriptional regulator [Ureaplasma sp.]|nr:YebC/PmpR family DNA-binding transcriptional regulator [Ureaplasma sp.]
MPRKHLIASGINKKQQQQAKVWMKYAKEIKAAAKAGGPNPEANPRLKAAIHRALQANLSRDSIERNINGASKEADKLKELTYEGYGPNGLAIIVKCLTDNENRTISNLRGYFSKLKGQITKPGAVKMLFDELGQFIIEKDKADENNILDIVMEYDIIDLKNDDEQAFELLVSPNAFFDVKNVLDQNNIPVFSSEIKLIPNSVINLNESENALLERFENQCDDDDDVLWVVHNLGEII